MNSRLIYGVLLGLFASLLFAVSANACSMEAEYTSQSRKTDLAPRLNHCPRDVVAFVRHEAACQHWSGESCESAGPECDRRNAQIAAHISTLQCDDLICHRQSMLNKYKHKNDIHLVLEKSLTTIYGDEFNWKNETENMEEACQKN